MSGGLINLVVLQKYFHNSVIKKKNRIITEHRAQKEKEDNFKITIDKSEKFNKIWFILIWLLNNI